MTTSHWPIVTEHEMMVMWSVPIVLFLLIVVWLRVICRSASLALSNDRVVFFFFSKSIAIQIQQFMNRDQERGHV